MKLLAPIAAVAEVEPLIAAGAEELYCGLVPAAWVKRAGAETWLNRRNPAGANLHGLDELAEVAGRAADRGVPVFLTLNAHRYDPEHLGFVVEVAGRAAEAGVAALIVADVGLMLALREADVPARVHVSSLGTCTNGEAARFYAELGADRVILPRHLSVREIAALHAAAPEVELEAFLLNDGCAFEEGRCLTTHVHGPICMTAWRSTVRARAGAPADLEARWRANEATYRRFLWHLNNCGSSTTAKGLPNGPCGLCALPALAAAGVASLKIVGREAPPWRKLASVQLAKAALDAFRAGGDAQAVAARARGLRATPELCDATYMCYYR